MDGLGVRDRALALVLLGPVLMVLAVLWVVVSIVDGRPFLFASERMATPDRSFRLLKIRTMRPAETAEGVLGAAEARRVTPLGRLLRRTRLDELPQIFNILSGDMGFIGPRPPLRRYVEAYPEVYADVLSSPPGVTGLATVVLHQREERLLAGCQTPESADETYRRRCIARKARIDRIYRANRSMGLDALILWRTVVRVLPSWVPARGPVGRWPRIPARRALAVRRVA